MGFYLDLISIEPYKPKNILLKGLIVVEKQHLGIDPIFQYHGQIFEFCGPKTRDANTMEWKEGSSQETSK